MSLNQRQQTILKVFCAYLTLTMLWPPFYIGIDGGGLFGLGYGFLFAPPHDRGRVDAAQLLAQWLLGAIIAVAAMLQAKNWAPSDQPGFTQRIGPAAKEGWRRSKWFSMVLIGMIFISILAAIGGIKGQAMKAGSQIFSSFILLLIVWIWHTQRAYRGIQPAVTKQATVGTSLKRISIAILLVVGIFGAVFALREGPQNKFWLADPVVEPSSGQFVPDNNQPWERDWSGERPANAPRLVFDDEQKIESKGNAFNDLVPKK